MQENKLTKSYKYAPITTLRKAIYGIQQHGELLCKYWELYKKLCAACHQHQFTDSSLVQYFYEGLCPNDRAMLDSAAE